MIDKLKAPLWAYNVVCWRCDTKATGASLRANCLDDPVSRVIHELARMIAEHEPDLNPEEVHKKELASLLTTLCPEWNPESIRSDPNFGKAFELFRSYIQRSN